jgi:iron complex outermembrane recepter protein
MARKAALLLALFLGSFTIFAQQQKVTGTVTDDETKELLIGVNIIYGPGKGTITDATGNYILRLDPGEYDLEISYVGYEKQSRHITVLDKTLYVDFSLKNITLSEVEVIGDIAKSRETPIAFSNIPPLKLEEELASQDLPMLMNATPGVYATQKGGGDGDSRINIRGFSQRNVAVLLDGIPVNDMENGWVYWSNWFGLDMVMRYTQIQRGLGASKLAIPSVGGTINMATKGIEDKKGLLIKQEVGGDGFMRTSLGLTSGRLKNGWGITFAGSFKNGTGWVNQTWTRGYFYFLRVDKELGAHLLSFTAMGAPQRHGQRSYTKSIATYDVEYAKKAGMTDDFIDQLETNGVPIDMGLRYNPNWGYLSEITITDSDTIIGERQETSTATNFYYKPVFSLRDFWNVNDRLYISNILYLSVGTGGGGSFSTTPSLEQETKQQNLQLYYNTNMDYPPKFNPNHQSSEIFQNAMNNHTWFGLLSTVDYTLNDFYTFSGGIDLRSYRGDHYREIDDLFGGDYFIDDGNQNEPYDSIKKYEGDVIGYHNLGLVRWGGLFGQLKYQRGNFSAFINLTGSYSGNKRIDYFIPKLLDVGDTTLTIGYNDRIAYNGVIYDHNSPGLRTNETGWKWIPGFTIKGGINYNLSENMNLFMNLGYLSKAQRFNNVYDYNNLLFKNIENEKVSALELGYSYYKSRITFNANAYYTIWKNKPSDRTYSIKIEDRNYSVNINDMNARHMGVEFEFAYKILSNLTFEALLSVGDWKWTSADTARVYDDNGIQVGTKPFDARGLYVGDAAQIQNRESLRWEIIRGLYTSGSFTWFGKHYAEFNPLDYDPEANPWAFDEHGDPIQSWKIPDYFMIDVHAGYYKTIKKVGFRLQASVLNLLNDKYITDAQNNDPYLTHQSSFDANSAGVFFGMGRRFNLSLQIEL